MRARPLIPAFESDGRLPPGIHEASWDELSATFGFTPGRRHMIGGLLAALGLLAHAGCRRAYIDGSFVSANAYPRDIDVAWDIDGVNLDQLDAVFVDFSMQRIRQRSRFGCEFFPASWDATGAGETFLQFFQRDRDGEPKGIILLSMESGYGE